MDTFTRRYVTVVALIAAMALVWWVVSRDGRVAQLNDELANDQQLRSYPYTFRVIAIQNGVALMSSPRSSQVSAIQGLRALFPELRNESAVSEPMVAAQKELARHQSLVASRVTAHPEVTQVRWQLDEVWLSRHGIAVP